MLFIILESPHNSGNVLLFLILDTLLSLKSFMNFMCLVPSKFIYISSTAKISLLLLILLKRNLKQGILGKVLLTNTTYLFYVKDKKVYLSTILYDSTNEILAYHIENNLKLDLAISTLHKLKNNKEITLKPDVFIHSDQRGSLYKLYFSKCTQRLYPRSIYI